jgi:DinB superfamily
MMNITLEKTELAGDLQNLNLRFRELLESFDGDRINKIPSRGGWSAAQVAEHIHKSDRGMIYLMSGPARKDTRPPDLHAEQIRNLFLDFDTKLNSPDFIIPENKLYNKESLLSAFAADRKKINEILLHSDLTETCTAFPFPGTGELTRLEIICFILAHTRRHIHQLEKIAQG